MQTKNKSLPFKEEIKAIGGAFDNNFSDSYQTL